MQKMMKANIMRTNIEIYLFSLPNCLPCQKLKKDLTENENVLKELQINEINFIDMSDVSDYNLDLVTKYFIRSAPTVVLVDKEIKSFTHVKTFEELVQKIQEIN